MTAIMETSPRHPLDAYLTPATLRLLVQIDELAGVGAAARSVGVSQPSASRTVATLERHLGFSLFTRTRRGSEATPEGAAIIAQAREVLASLDAMISVAEGLGAHEPESLHLAASRTIGEHLVPRWLGAHAAAYPDVWVAFRFANSAVVIRWVKEGLVSVGFIEDPTPPEGLASEVLNHDSLAIIAPPHHAWAGRAISPQELASTGLVEREPGSGTRATLDAVLPERPHPLVELDSNAAIVRAVAAGVGPAVLSEMAVQRHVRDGAVALVQWNGPALERPLRAIWRADTRASREVMDFLEVVRENSRH